MNNKLHGALLKFLSNKDTWKMAKKTFDRSFVLTAVEENGKAIVQFEERDNGREYMTTADVAAYLDRNSRTIRQWCEAKSQRQTVDPIPYFRLYGELRFERAKIVAWQKRLSDATVALAPVKGKR